VRPCQVDVLLAAAALRKLACLLREIGPSSFLPHNKGSYANPPMIAPVVDFLAAMRWLPPRA